MPIELSPFGHIVLEDRYALKDETGKLIEKDIFETFRRVAKSIASKEKDPDFWEEKFYRAMSEKYFCPAGRVLAHSGTSYSQLFNCFVLPFEEDSLESIMDTAKKMAVVQKHAGGTGFNYSRLRPAGSYIKGVNGHSCGVPGFIHMMSTTSEVIEQGGSRRGANLGLLEVGHPDIWEFISYKTGHNWEHLKSFMSVKDEDKWQEFKFENNYKWQMYNVSVGVNDNFFDALEKDGEWPLIWDGEEWDLYTVVFKRYKSDGVYKESRFEVTANNESTALWKTKRNIPFPSSLDKFEIKSKRKIKAQEIWDKICYNAWADGCPGLINLSTAKKMHNLEYINPILSTNPCFYENEEIETEDGYKKFIDLKDKTVNIVTPNGLEKARIWKTGEKRTIKIKCNSLLELIVTPDQLIMTADGREIRAEDCKHERLNVFKKTPDNFDLLWVKLGFIQGDANLSRLKNKHRHKGLEINLGKKDQDIKDLFNYTGDGRCFYTTEYVSYLKKYGFSDQILPHRELPKIIPVDKELSFLRGLYSANGGIIKNKRISFKSTCRKLIEGLKELLFKYGINSYITTNKPKRVKFKNGQYFCRESFDLNINQIFSIVRFHELIGFHHKYKTNALLDLIEKKSPYVSSIKDMGIQSVYDFSVKSNWGYVKGIKVHNCGEQLLSEYSSCNLSSLVLSSFIDRKLKGSFDFEKLIEIVKIAVRFGDNVIDNCDFPILKIEKKAKEERRVGIGLMGVHDTLIALNLDYDSDKGREFIGLVLRTIRDTAYLASIELAKEKGAFPLFDKEKFLESGFIKTLPDKIRKSIQDNGIRNSTLLTQAPTGSISALLSVSSGCEPWFALKFQRNTKLGSYEDGCPSYLEWVKNNPDKEKPSYFKTSQEIDPIDHVKMLLVFSKYVCSSVSKTVNLSNSADVKEISEIFQYAMKSGAKGITVFRDGCKDGVLINKDNKKIAEEAEKVVHDLQNLRNEETFEIGQFRKRGNRTEGSTYRVHMQNHNLYITVNRNKDGELVEVFATVGESKNVNTSHTSGVEDSWAEGLGKIISLALRAGVDIKSIIRNLKNIPSDKPVFVTIGDCDSSELIPSPPHAIARIIEEESNKKVSVAPERDNKDLSMNKICRECGSQNTKSKGPTCYTCIDCGNESCG